MSLGDQGIAQQRGSHCPHAQVSISGWDGVFERCLSLEHHIRRNAVEMLVWPESRVTREWPFSIRSAIITCLMSG